MRNYEKVILNGRFDFSSQTLQGPRPNFNETDRKFRTGNFVITAFVTDKNRRVLINRGLTRFSENINDTKDIEGDVELICVYRTNQYNIKQFKMSIPNEIAAKQLKCEPYYFELHQINKKQTHQIIKGQTKYDFRNNHFEYMSTWAFAAFLALRFYKVKVL